MSKAESASTAKKKTATKASKTAPKAKSATEEASVIGPNTVFTVTLAAQEIADARSSALQRAQAQMKLEGFRKGKAPLKLIEKSIEPSKLQELTLERLLPQAYHEYVTQHALRPLTDPEVKIVEMKPEGEWTFEFQVAEPPEVKLGEYTKLVTNLKKTNELWKNEPTIPEDGDKDAKVQAAQERAQHRQKQVDALLRALLEKIVIVVPELLVRQQTQEHLHQLSHQLEHMNISLEEYLKRIEKSLEELQQETAARSLASLQIEFLLGAIISQAKIELSDEEITAALPADRQSSDSDRRYVMSMLLKQKAVDHLLTLS